VSLNSISAGSKIETWPHSTIENIIKAKEAAYYAVYASFVGLQFGDLDLKELNKFKADEIIRALSAENMHQVYESWPVPAETILHYLFINLGRPDLAEKVVAFTFENSESSTEITSIKPNKTVFEKYCYQCHGTSASVGQYLPLDNTKELGKNTLIKKLISDKKIPIPLKGVLLPTNEEIQEMLNSLSGASN
jgi:cytochrome c5